MPKGVTREAYVDAMKKLNEIGREFKKNKIKNQAVNPKAIYFTIYSLIFYFVSI